jgi:1-carboxybiuret hydrolase
MGEYAYDFTGENAHDGVCRNPVDPARMAGGSSSGSAAATAAGLAPVSLGSDTNGSIRVPASFCGIFGLKPTYGRLGRSGTFPFCDSLDHLGPLARSVRDLALAYDALQVPDPADHACTTRPREPVTPPWSRHRAGSGSPSPAAGSSVC